MKIDIGCGTRPAPGFDVYIDVYMSKEVKNNSEISKKFVKTAMEDMSMFKDKQFEYARCHHVIEHVNDPNKACSEMIRTAKKGTLWFPTVEADILFGRRDHNWLVFQNKPNHLLFIKKRFASYYGQGRAGLPAEIRGAARLQQKPFEWEGSFTWTVVL